MKQLEKLQHEIIASKKVENYLRASLNEKETLLREIHHRVKNNLQCINSLIDLSSMFTRNNQMKNLLKEVNTRIHTIALIHSQLSKSNILDKIDMGDLINELILSVLQIYKTNKKSINHVFRFNNVYLFLDQAIPCALIINELISNSFKHAFKGKRKGMIEVTIHRMFSNMVIIRVKDDGIGISEEIDINSDNSLGLMLVRNLIKEQLMGTIQVEHNNGTEITIKFKILNKGRNIVKNHDS